MNPDTSLSTQYDLIVIGGALSGASTALLAKRWHPGLRVLILERSTEFTRRVGESTVEISSHFLGRVLGLTEYLMANHVPKQGLRFWFTNEKGVCPDSCSELGPHYNVRLSSYQVDRALLDEHILELCVAEGVELIRPAEVKEVELEAGGEQKVVYTIGSERRQATGRWLVDASGMARLLARKNNWVRRNTEHPISSIWARWRGVRHWDNRELRARYPRYAGRGYAVRNSATNHLVGKGWWSWWIPLKNGDISIGVVYDERLVEPPPGDKPLDRLMGLLEQHPLARILLENAKPVEDDVHWRRNLPYWSEEMIGDGFALVGDAAGFIDPFYSPGMDWISFTAYSAADLVVRERQSRLESGEIGTRNRLFRDSYHRWFKAIYKDKYYYMGDFELMSLAFRLDVGLYYFGVVNQPYKYGDHSFTSPPFVGPRTRFPAWIIALYNRRLSAMGRSRMERGTWGRRNNDSYFAFKSFGLDYTLHLRNLASFGKWLLLELREGWRTWGRPSVPDTRTNGLTRQTPTE